MPHSGPRHAAGCLGDVRVLNTPTGHGFCNCERATWLGEQVTRGQARAELLEQLANWAHEQRIFTASDIDAVQTGGPGAGTTAGEFVAAGVLAASRIAEHIWIAVRMGALNLAKECSPYVAEPASAARYVEVDPEVVETVTTSGGVL